MEIHTLAACEKTAQQRAFSVSGRDSVPNLADFTEYERMVGEYRVMDIYPRGM